MGGNHPRHMARWAALLLLSGAAAYLHPGSSPNLHRRAIAGAGRRGLSSMRCSSTDLGDVAHFGAVIPGLRSEWSRRVVLFGAALTAAVPRVARAYDFKRETSGDTVFDVPDVWRKTASDAESGTFAFSNPVSGKVLDQIIVREFEAPQGITSTKDLGKIEKIKPSKAFGATKEVDAADMVAAAVRKGTGSKTVFYDFDFAIAPKTCSRENEMLVGSCMYEKIILLSCCVTNGGIYVLEISASSEEWKKNGPSLRSVRDSFNVNT